MSEGLTLSPQALLHQGERTRNRLGRRRMNFFNTILHPGYTRPQKIHDRMPQYVAFQEQLYRAVKRVTGCSTIVDNSKDPYYAYILGTIPAVDLKVLHLVRDARAVAHSRVKRRKTQIVTKERSMTMGQRMGMLRSAKDWVLINHVAERLFGRDSTGYFRLRYEDLVRDPGATLGAVADFAGMTAPPSVSGADGEITLAPTHQFSGNPIRVEHGATTIRDPEPWRSDLSRAERFLIHAICGRHQRRYAYA